ncbi:MAG TPA: tetratricopeptide repeat protein, partial [Verrucomicrobiae bacterium]|nr:tetratricopeptide repeat protein [Verrucomicrobiae bacterium]
YHHAGRSDDAVRAYQQALALDRNLVAARFNLGALYLEENNLPAAVTELTTFTGLQPGSSDGWLKLGTAQLRARQLDAAEKNFHQAIRLNSRSAEAVNGLGLVQMQRRRYQDAWQQFCAALRQQPDYPPALLNAAIVSQQHLNNRAFALQRYREYLALKPAPPGQAEVRLIVSQLESELSPRVRPAISGATNPPPQLASPIRQTEPPMTTNTSPLAAQNGKISAPTSAPTVLVPPRVAPATSAPPARTVASNAAAPNRIESAPTAPQKNVELVRLDSEEPVKPVRDVPASIPPASQRTETVSSKNGSGPSGDSGPSPTKPLTNSSAARPTNEKPALVTRLNPKNWFRATDRPSTARVPEERRESISASPRYKYRSPAAAGPGNRGEAERLVAEGVQAQQRNRLTDAREAYRKAIRADPSLFEAHYNLGVATFEAGDLAQALDAYEHALALNPISVKARFNFAVALQKGNYPRDAANELEKLLTDNPAEARAHFTAANLYAQQLGEPARARAHYVQVLELEPQHPQATAIRFWLEGNR